MEHHLTFIENELQQAKQTLTNFLQEPVQLAQILNGAQIMSQAIKAGHKIISCGNGGSHCDAMHFAEELSGRYRENRPALPALAISDPSHISCVSNDFGYEFVFSRFVEAVGQSGDVLLGISTSGNSASVIRAVEAAKQKNLKTVLLLGKDGGKLKSIADAEIVVPHFGYADRIQEIHIKIIHIWIGLIEKMVFQS
jgi:D-sedoheptulose 7-phosphate isomerase